MQAAIIEGSVAQEAAQHPAQQAVIYLERSVPQLQSTASEVPPKQHSPLSFLRATCAHDIDSAIAVTGSYGERISAVGAVTSGARSEYFKTKPRDWRTSWEVTRSMRRSDLLTS